MPAITNAEALAAILLEFIKPKNIPMDNEEIKDSGRQWLLLEEEVYGLYGTFLWHKIKVISFVVSPFLVAILIYVIAKIRAPYSLLLAIITILVYSLYLIYYVWSVLILKSYIIEIIRRKRQDTFNSYLRYSHIIGEVGVSVSTQILSSIILLVYCYSLIVVAFGGLYEYLQVTSAKHSLLNNIYFSFVTMATIGYGDIQPLGFGKVLISIQSVISLVYQIICIAGFISIISKITTDPGRDIGFS